jgi:hypothetical protein
VEVADSRRLIFRIYVHLHHTGLWAGVVRRCVPCAFEQRHSAEFLYCDIAPVSRRIGRLQPTAALSPVLITQHTKLSFTILAQPVQAEPSITPAKVARTGRLLKAVVRSS